VLNALAPKLPWLIGGSADLAPSTMTNLKDPSAGDFSAANYGGRNFHFGIREHGMAAALNGMCATGIRAYGATFFVFTDYMRPSMRLAALQQLPALYVLTHDSIGVGEDGPTHQPVEHLAAMRAIPNMLVIRPGDANEVSEAYRVYLRQKHRPISLVLSRQNLPTLDRTKYASAEGTVRGAYVMADARPGETPEVILMATGSELAATVDAYEKLASQGIAARLVSFPCTELFDEQDEDYRHSVLPPACTARVAVEAAVKMGWDKYLGERGEFVGMKGFGASAPGGVLARFFGFTADNIVEHAKKAIENAKK
jgi:transketolase